MTDGGPSASFYTQGGAWVHVTVHTRQSHDDHGRPIPGHLDITGRITCTGCGHTEQPTTSERNEPRWHDAEIQRIAYCSYPTANQHAQNCTTPPTQGDPHGQDH